MGRTCHQSGSQGLRQAMVSSAKRQCLGVPGDGRGRGEEAERGGGSVRGQTYCVGQRPAGILPAGGPGHSPSPWPSGMGGEDPRGGAGVSLQGEGRGDGHTVLRVPCARATLTPLLGPRRATRSQQALCADDPTSPSRAGDTSVYLPPRQRGDPRPGEQAGGCGGGIPFGDPRAALPRGLRTGGLWDRLG